MTEPSAPVTLFSTLAVQAALEKELPVFSSRTGIKVDVTFDPTTVLRQRIDDGARPEVVVGITDAVDSLAEAGILAADSVTPLARSRVGLAVAPGAPHPSIGTVEELISTLLAARSVAYSRTGASGIYFARVLEELGIADEVNQRATVVEKGFTAFAVVDGRADLAVQQLSELRFVADAEIVGPFPDEIQQYTSFAVAARAGGISEQASQLLAFLTDATTKESYRQSGLES